MPLLSRVGLLLIGHNQFVEHAMPLEDGLDPRVLLVLQLLPPVLKLLLNLLDQQLFLLLLDFGLEPRLLFITAR